MDDPLAWPFSTHRDCLGLTLEPIRSRVADPLSFHTYVSSDPSVCVTGTSLPVGSGRSPDEAMLEAAVSEALRVPLATIRDDATARRLLIQGGRDWAGWNASQVAQFAGTHRSTVFRVPRLEPETERLLARIAGDPRLPGLVDGDLRRMKGWERYRFRR